MVRCGNKLDSAETPGDLFQYLDSIFDGDIETAEEYSEINWPETLYEEVGNMSDDLSWEDYIKSVKEEARQEGKREGKLIAKVLAYRDWDVSIPTIAKRCKITEKEVEKIIVENNWGMLKEEP